MVQQNNIPINTLQKSLLTARLFPGFWERWTAHGLNPDEALQLRTKLTDQASWEEGLVRLAERRMNEASSFLGQGLSNQAEYAFRLAGLHYNLLQWIFPEPCKPKRLGYDSCREAVKRADAVAAIPASHTEISVNGRTCFGRIRLPEHPKGCVVMVNPIDSSKEELFTYEMDFADAGFVTMNFDGPGQGETLLYGNVKASTENWQGYLERLLAWVKDRFPKLPVLLFGTSSGAAWAIEAGRHPAVKKVAAVSPACGEQGELPDYFRERMACILEAAGRRFLPEWEFLGKCGPVLLVHGDRDVMVGDEEIRALYHRLPEGKRLLVYEAEGHCCNGKLGEIRQIAMKWFFDEEEGQP